jgi:TIR domain
MKGSILISYRHKEADAFANRLAAELRRDGYEVFIDVDIHAGEKWREKIEQALSSCAVLPVGRRGCHAAYRSVGDADDGEDAHIGQLGARATAHH